jgi:hypothetical protein
MKDGDKKRDLVDVYVTKYWETQGIWKMRGELSRSGKPDIVYFQQQTRNMSLFVGPKDYALTLEGAQLQVRTSLARKIKSVEKKLAKLKAVRPEAVEVKDLREYDSDEEPNQDEYLEGLMKKTEHLE